MDSQRSCQSPSGSDVGDAGGVSKDARAEAGEDGEGGAWAVAEAVPPEFDGSVFTVSHMVNAARRSRTCCLREQGTRKEKEGQKARGGEGGELTLCCYVLCLRCRRDFAPARPPSARRLERRLLALQAITGIRTPRPRPMAPRHLKKRVN